MFPQHGASKGLNRDSSPSTHTSPATLRYLQIHIIHAHVHTHMNISSYMYSTLAHKLVYMYVPVYLHVGMYTV